LVIVVPLKESVSHHMLDHFAVGDVASLQLRGRALIGGVGASH
jgi:hypothetical protein